MKCPECCVEMKYIGFVVDGSNIYFCFKCNKKWEIKEKNMK